MKTSKTFSIYFWIHTSKNKGEMAPIYARITIDQKRVEISLKRLTEVTYWDTRSERTNWRASNGKDLNVYLDQVYSDLLECHKQLFGESKYVTA